MTYINSYKNQNWLIPQSIKDMIPKDHICFFVEEFIESRIESSRKIIDKFGKRCFEESIQQLKDLAWIMKTKINERDLTQFPFSSEFIQNIYAKREGLRKYAKERLPGNVYWAIDS